ncbi:MAG: hypothetical protein EOP10_01715 [Proteobacteria bacterium]|nr:MAG: hypothetical protein EOP10_01715 [Pseudomonadota bacterium]
MLTLWLLVSKLCVVLFSVKTKALNYLLKDPTERLPRIFESDIEITTACLGEESTYHYNACA